MRISKPLRQILYLVPGVIIALVAVGLALPAWGAIAYVFLLFAVPPISLLFSAPIDWLDMWLRRRTKDPLWLVGHEGRAWLASDEGKRWRDHDERRRR